MKLKFLMAVVLIMAANLSYAASEQPLAKHVVFLSLDGFRPDVIQLLGPARADAFYRMINEGASTLNARTDNDFTVTLPNHTCMITGYPVLGLNGHHVTENSMLPKLVHDYAGRRVGSVFQVLRDHHRQGAMLASKLKFNVFERSFPIDTVSLTDADDLKTLSLFEKISRQHLPDFVFMHFAGTDHVGHQKGWDVSAGSDYMKEAVLLNQYLKRIMKAIEGNKQLKANTVLIVTADHGGQGKGHGDSTNPLDYTVPFMIWGKPVAKGVDLYKLNQVTRKDPLQRRVSYREEFQPIRNGDAANLALSLLGLPAVDGSTIGNKQPLKVTKD